MARPLLLHLAFLRTALALLLQPPNVRVAGNDGLPAMEAMGIFGSASAELTPGILAVGQQRTSADGEVERGAVWLIELTSNSSVVSSEAMSTDSLSLQDCAWFGTSR